MYNVSNTYMTEWNKPSKSFSIWGSIGNHNFWEDNIIRGSLRILYQCSSRNEVQIGSVYSAQLDATFVNIPMSRRSWKGKTIELSEGLGLPSGQYEYVPLGVFTISEAEHMQGGVVVTAFDNMVKFDRGFRLNNTRGSAYQLLRLACNNCGVELGMSRAEVEALPNGGTTLVLNSENDIETYRDFLSWVAQTLASFAYINRAGKLRLKAYSDNVDIQIDKTIRFTGGVVSDYVTRYTGLSVVDFKTESTKYYGLEVDDGLTYNLGSNPLLQNGSDVVKDNMRKAVLNGLSVIDYTPFEISGHFGGLFDLGDVIDLHDGIGVNSIGCIMSIEYRLNDSVKLAGFGANPELASAKSKTDKNIAGLLNKDKGNEIQFYNFVNADNYTVGQSAVNVIDMLYTTISDTNVVFQGEISCNVTSDCVVEVTYLIDGVAEAYHPTETWEAGKHILSLMYFMGSNEYESHDLVVQLKCLSGSLTIDADSARSIIWGQGLVAEQEWDGRLQFTERINLIDIDESIGFETFTYSMTAEAQNPISNTFEEEFGLINIDENITVEEFNEVLYMNKLSLHDEYWADVYEYTWAQIHDNYLW